MADTTSAGLQLLLQETGGNNNTWGVLLNQTLQKIEDGITGGSSIPLTGGSITLTDDQARPHALVFTGILTSAAVVNVPNRLKSWLIINGTTGDFPLSIKATAEPTGYTLAKGGIELLWCNSSSVGLVGAAGQVPVGTVINFAGTTVPPNYLLCDGSSISRATYGRLFAAIGGTWGSGDGSTTFTLPNGQDRYPRGKSSAYPVGTYLTQLIQSHTHTGISQAVGDHTHYLEPHYGHAHLISGAGGGTANGGPSAGVGYQNLGNLAQTEVAGSHGHAMGGAGGHAHDLYINAAGGDENRPNSLIYLPCIRYQ